MVSFKQTDIGRIPVDWNVVSFTDIAELKHGFQFQEEHFSKTGIGVVKIGTLTNSAGLDFTRLTFTHQNNIKRFRKFLLNNGDILMALTGATLGKVAKVDTDRTLLQNYRVGNFIPNNKTTREYLYHISQSFLIQKTVKHLVNEAAQPNLGKADFDKILIPLPPLPEQVAIAEVLSDTDSLITALEKRIAKKRLIKQGTMQKLLTPKDNWEVKKLGEVAEIYQSETISQEVFTKDGFLVYGANGIVGKYKKYNHKSWQTTITCRGSTCGTVNKTTDKCWITGNAMVVNIDSNPKLQKTFFYHLLKRQDFTNCITGSGQPQIVREPLFNFEITIPTLPEQNRIAAILSDMDREINVLEKKLTKTKQLKQGLMQLLLTGKIRLV